MNKLNFRQFVLREQLKSKWKILDILFGNNYDNHKDYYDWIIYHLNDKFTSSKTPVTSEEWEKWLDRKLGKI